MSQKTQTMHGRDHAAGGADPIPGLGGAGGIFVIPNPDDNRRILWSGWHGLVDSGASGVTRMNHTIPAGAIGAGALPEEKFYAGTETPAGTSTHGAGCYGVGFQAPTSGVEVIAVQFYRRTADGTGTVRVKIYDGSTCVASGSANASPGWNRIPVGAFPLVANHTYVAAIYSATAVPGVTSPGGYPKATSLVTTAPVGSNPGRYPNSTNEDTFTWTATTDEYFISPVVRSRASFSWYAGTEVPQTSQADTTNGAGAAFTCLADQVVCTGIQIRGYFFSGVTINARLWTASGQLLASSAAYGNAANNWVRVAFTPVALTPGQTYIVDWYGSYHSLNDTAPTWPHSVVGAGGVTLASSVASLPGRTGGSSSAPPLTATNNEWWVSPILVQDVSAQPDIVVVATPAPGTAAGVYVKAATADPDEIILYWSAPNSLVSANVMAIGGAGSA